MPHWSTLAIAIGLILMLSVIASAHAGGKKVRLCELRGPCVVVTMPGPNQCRDIFGYWVCHGRPRK